MNAKKRKTSQLIGFAAVVLAAVLLIVFSDGIYAKLSEISFLKPTEQTEPSDPANPENPGGTKPEDSFAITYGSYAPGTYTAKMDGFESYVSVTVEVSETEILSVSIDASGESSIGIDAAKSISQAMLSGQTAEVDAVSGATWTSDAAIKAVKTALEEASKK